MDLLISDGSDGSHSSASAASDDTAAPVAADRASMRVGTRLPLGSFSGKCIGDDMSWKGSLTLRIACVQCGSVGRDRVHWGMWHAQGLSSLGADVGLLSETALHSEPQHASASRGMELASYRAVSHGKPLQHTTGLGSGVLLAVHSGYAGNWQNIARDALGRAVAASVISSTGTVVRFVAVYGPVGACLPGFTNPQQLDAETNLKAFIDSQIDLALSSQTLLIVGGDLNSFCSDQLDRWEGSYTVRPDCLAAHLSNKGLIDTFRLRHPTLRAFTFFSQAASASRLDALWLLPTPCLEVSVLNAAVVWNWPRRADHAPVLADLSIHLPSIPSSPQNPPPWKCLVARLDLDLRDYVADRLPHHEAGLRRFSASFDAILSEWQSLPAPICEGTDGLPTHPTLALPAGSAAELGKSFDGLMRALLACLPDEPKPTSRVACKASEAWAQCLAVLRMVRQMLLDQIPMLCEDRLDVNCLSLDLARTLWDKARRSRFWYMQVAVPPPYLLGTFSGPTR